MSRSLRSIVGVTEPRDAAPAPGAGRLLNMAQARALLPVRADGRPWSVWWMRQRCAPKAKRHMGGRVWWEESALRAWIDTLAEDPTP
jgi:predicted DNA-binding transcriptional regulator AlpA